MSRIAITGITETNAVVDRILSRSATRYDDPSATLGEDEIGFDADALHREFGLGKEEVPVMLLSIDVLDLV